MIDEGLAQPGEALYGPTKSQLPFYRALSTPTHQVYEHNKLRILVSIITENWKGPSDKDILLRFYPSLAKSTY
jgi:hypothetical protein